MSEKQYSHSFTSLTVTLTLMHIISLPHTGCNQMYHHRRISKPIRKWSPTLLLNFNLHDRQMNTPRLALAHRGSRDPQSAQLLFSSFLQMVSNLFLILSWEAIRVLTTNTPNFEPPPSLKQLWIPIYSFTVAIPRLIYTADTVRSGLKYHTERGGGCFAAVTLTLTQSMYVHL